MHRIPTRRLFVYVAAGLVVLVVGIVGLVEMRGGGRSGNDALVIDATAGTLDGGVGAQEPATLAGPDVASSSTTGTVAAKIWVQVAGAVARPGVYQLEKDARVFEAVLLAGGFASDADQQAATLAARLSDGCRVYVPHKGELPVGAVQAPSQSTVGVAADPATAETAAGGADGPVSLNTATVEQLDTLPGVGPSLARQIVAYRETKGPFTSVDQLDDVPGIGPAKLEQLRPLVCL